MKDGGEKNAFKQVRIVVELLLLLSCFGFAFVLNIGTSDYDVPDVVVEEIPTVYQTAYEGSVLKRVDAEGYPMVQYGEAHFAALCYPGLTTDESNDEKVYLAQFKLQMQQLSRAGYTTITPEEASAFLLNSVWPPPKSVMIIIEDDTIESARMAMETLVDLDFTAVLSIYAADVVNGKISGESLRQLEQGGRFVIATRGYERSYINVFDRSGSYIGDLSADEFDAVKDMVGDYTYSLMDYKRDSDRLPIETDAQLQARITEDYRKIGDALRGSLGRTPVMLMLTRPNTGAFGETQAASEYNQRAITSTFALNFNRKGTAFNSQAIPVLDLSYMQVESDFSANHLMMKLWDDTADDVVFALGSEDESKKWMVDQGIAQFDAGSMTLTTLPNSSATASLKDLLLDDFELDVTLKGATAGRQSLFLRTDRQCQAGVELCFEDDVLTIREAGNEENIFLRMNLSSFDGDRVLSVEEVELASQIALNEAIMQYDTNESRRQEAATNLTRLRRLSVRTVEEGAEAATTSISGTERQDRKLHVRMVGERLTLTIDDKTAADQLVVETCGRGTVAVGAGVSASALVADTPDDVYDGVFEGLTILNLSSEVYYAYPVVVEVPIEVRAQTWVDRITNRIQEFF